MNTGQWQEAKKLFHRALDLSGETRSAFLRGSCHDQKIIEQVESLLLAHESAGNFIVEPVLVEAGLASSGHEATSTGESSFIGRRIGSYEIVRELGRGGMGAVFLAVRADAQFEKQAAIKIVKRGMDTESILRRFMMERQILANLEHENIARFLDGGTTEDGLPYFVMEYVEGEPITKYCAARDLNTTERLRLFQQVCAAVQHAHQNLIVHRDLKPSNILVTSDSIPKLLDFGIAKLLNPDWAGEATEETTSVLRLMTPEYASPEQLRGLPITTATDVYSLGIVLYELLSGQRPFRFRTRLPEEIVRVVLTEEPTRPSVAISDSGSRNSEETDRSAAVGTNIAPTARNAKSLRGDLDNIVLKALRKDRERRYLSVEELSEDIRRHLQGLPVTARKDTVTYRAGKFVQRHKAGVAMAVAVVITLLSATIITAWQAHIAKQERAKAERRFTEQRKLANSLITEVESSLKDIPYAVPTRRLLAQKSLEYLNDLAKDAGDDPAFLGDLASAYRNVAYYQTWTLQDNPGAILSAKHAIELCRRRVTLDPNNPDAKRDLSEAIGSEIQSLSLMGQVSDIVPLATDQLRVEQERLAGDPRNPHYLMRVAEAAEGFGETLRELRRLDEANTQFRAAIEMSNEAINIFRDQAVQPAQRVDLSFMYENQGSMYEQLHEPQNAIDSYRHAGAIAEAVYREHKDMAQALRNTCSSHWFLGLMLDRQGDYPGALENFRISLKTVTEPEAVKFDLTHYGEAKYSIVVGKALSKIGDKQQGAALIRHGLEVIRNYVSKDRGDTENVYYACELFTWGVEGLSLAGRKDEAENDCLEIAGLVEQTERNAPSDPNPRLRLASLDELLGNVYAGYDDRTHKIKTRNRTQLIQARRWYQEGRDLLAETKERFKVSSASSQDQLTALQEKIAECEALLGPQK